MASALKSARKMSIPVLAHCEDKALSGKGVMNMGFISTKMGLRGIPRESEYAIVKRDIGLASKASAHIHIAHVSCRESVEIIRKAKKDGVSVTAETAPHYFSLTDDCCVTYDTNTKMNPPLRTTEDVEAVKAGLADGTIDVIATDHAPHTDCEKDVEFDFAPFGIIGLETALGLSVIELVEKKVLTWPGLISKLSSNPAAILGIGRQGLKKGSPADIVIIDPSAKYVYAKESIESKSKNSPFVGWELKGRAVAVLVGGRVVMEKGSVKA
jgi:dihydroorotase